jgi:hypothetical protein
LPQSAMQIAGTQSGRFRPVVKNVRLVRYAAYIQRAVEMTFLRFLEVYNALMRFIAEKSVSCCAAQGMFDDSASRSGSRDWDRWLRQKAQT